MLVRPCLRFLVHSFRSRRRLPSLRAAASPLFLSLLPFLLPAVVGGGGGSAAAVAIATASAVVGKRFVSTGRVATAFGISKEGIVSNGRISRAFRVRLKCEGSNGGIFEPGGIESQPYSPTWPGLWAAEGPDS